MISISISISLSRGPFQKPFCICFNVALWVLSVLSFFFFWFLLIFNVLFGDNLICGMMIGGEKKCLNSELWHACAGPLVSLPTAGTRVVYFPQGHSEQVLFHSSPYSTACFCLLYWLWGWITFFQFWEWKLFNPLVVDFDEWRLYWTCSQQWF